MKLKVENLNTYFGENQILKNINMEVPKNSVTALIDPSGCGKSICIRFIWWATTKIMYSSYNSN